MKKLAFAFFIVGFILNPFLSISQNTYSVPGDFLTIRDAVSSMNNDDTLLIHGGFHTDSVHINYKNLVFIGDENNPPIFSPGANGKSFIVSNASVEFHHLRFTDSLLQSPPPNFAIDGSNSNMLISHCTFEKMISPISLLWGDLAVHHCSFSNSRGIASIVLNGGTFNLHNNLFYGTEWGAISINRAHGEIFNNTIIGTSTTAHFGIIINSDSITRIFNNIICNYGVGIMLTASDSMELNALHIQHNNISQVAAPYWYEYNENLSLPIYSGALNPSPAFGEISAANLFTDSLNMDFGLTANSPNRNAGITISNYVPSTDLAGNPRISGSSIDIGAFEFQMHMSVAEFTESAGFSVFPNPSAGRLQVQFDSPITGSIDLIAPDGKIWHTEFVHQSKEHSLSLDAPAGIYFLRLSASHFVKTKIIHLL